MQHPKTGPLRMTQATLGGVRSIMMPVGPILLAILVVLIYTGFLGGVLGRLKLSRRAALALTAAMLAGALVEVPVASGLSVNLGGGLIPLGLAFYFVTRADNSTEPLRAFVGALAVAAAVFFVGRLYPPGQPTELNLFYLDAQYLFALTAGAMGFLIGAARGTGFAAAVFGVLAADLLHYSRLFSYTPAEVGALRLGGGGFQETAVVAGLFAIALAEWVGEVRPPVRP